jgi:hypothetical protein
VCVCNVCAPQPCGARRIENHVLSLLVLLLVSDPCSAGAFFFIGATVNTTVLVEATARGIAIPTCVRATIQACSDPPGQSATRQNRRNDNIAIQRHARA